MVCGEVAGLFDKDEMEGITSQLAEEEIPNHTTKDSEQQLWAKFVQVHLCKTSACVVVTICTLHKSSHAYWRNKQSIPSSLFTSTQVNVDPFQIGMRMHICMYTLSVD